jgi:unsaturated chondroitin disaccharide hydrolase
MIVDFQAALDRSFQKTEIMTRKLQHFPHITKQGEWLTHANGHWTGGFWTGILWLRSFYTSEPGKAKELAHGWAIRFKARVHDNKTHDMGFIFGPSCVLGYRIHGDPELLNTALHGANNMRDLYEDKVGLILAWDEPGYEGKAIVDTIMNLPLMIWASEQSNDPDLKSLACRVADHIRLHHVRADYSIYHMVKWDTSSYEIIERTTHQGFSPETCWSRGQSWALYGFANMYRYSSEIRYLETSEQLAEYFWNHLDDTLLPKWDFVFRNQTEEPIDAAAASIAASGMLLISDLLQQDNQLERAQLWQERGERIVQALIEHCFYTSLDKYGIIEKATVDKPRNSGVGESTMYGDYYFVEALYRILNRNDRAKLDLLY